MKKILSVLSLVALTGLFMVGCKKEVKVTTLTVTPAEKTLMVGATATISTAITADINIKVAPADAALTIASEDPAVATVENGVITAVAKGTTNITVKAGDMSKSVAITVTSAEDLAKNFVLNGMFYAPNASMKGELADAQSEINSAMQTFGWVLSDKPGFNSAISTFDAPLSSEDKDLVQKFVIDLGSGVGVEPYGIWVSAEYVGDLMSDGRDGLWAQFQVAGPKSYQEVDENYMKTLFKGVSYQGMEENVQVPIYTDKPLSNVYYYFDETNNIAVTVFAMTVHDNQQNIDFVSCDVLAYDYVPSTESAPLRAAQLANLATKRFAPVQKAF